jgi:ribonuclease HI
MGDAANVIAKATGCTLKQAHTAIDTLIARGWTPPNDGHSPVENDGVPGSATALPGLSAANVDEVLIAHTDGACSGNPGPGGWAVVFSQGDKAVAEYVGCEVHSTSNRMELTAAREAIRHAPNNVRLEIVTDSKNVIGWLSQGWKRNHPAIAALCAEIDQLRSGRSVPGAQDGGVRFRHVLGHKGDEFNERADSLASSAADRVRKDGRCD